MAKTYNFHVEGVVRRLNRLKFELEHCESAGISYFRLKDRNRIDGWMKELDGYFTHAAASELDLRETHGFEIDLGEMPAPIIRENELVNDASRMICAFRNEIIHSASSRMASGFVPPDIERVQEFFKHAKAWIAYMDASTPVDYGESSPQAPMAPQGFTGV